jgi:hypothetical protein
MVFSSIFYECYGHHLPLVLAQPKVTSIFLNHLQILKTQSYPTKITQQNGVCHPLVLDATLFEQQSSFFITTVKSNCSSTMLPPHDYNPTTYMWRRMANSLILKVKMFEFFKLVELAIVMVLGNVEDERTFSTLTFTKSKLKH